MSENKRAEGERLETIAAALLTDNGYTVLARNWRRSTGEIDIVAEEDGWLVFVEVKYRRSGTAGAPEEAVDRRKQARIRRTAEWYLKENGIPVTARCRFDVVSYGPGGVRLIRNAFGGM